MNEQIAAFGDLHVPGHPLILVNIWDAAMNWLTGQAKTIFGGGEPDY